jgi:hypothetical protein
MIVTAYYKQAQEGKAKGKEHAPHPKQRKENRPALVARQKG